MRWVGFQLIFINRKGPYRVASMTVHPPYYCIAHQSFPWSMPEFMTVIGTGNYVPEHGIAMSQAFPELANQNSYLGEYVALYAIRELLRKSNTDGFVGFCHYRRITLTKQHGELRRINIHAHPNQLQAMSLVDFYWDRNTPIIPATASMMVSILQQYAVCGLNSRDLLLYFASAIDCNVITSAEAAEFLSSNQLISAPTVSFNAGVTVATQAIQLILVLNFSSFIVLLFLNRINRIEKD